LHEPFLRTVYTVFPIPIKSQRSAACRSRYL